MHIELITDWTDVVLLSFLSAVVGIDYTLYVGHVVIAANAITSRYAFGKRAL